MGENLRNPPQPGQAYRLTRGGGMAVESRPMYQDAAQRLEAKKIQGYRRGRRSCRGSTERLTASTAIKAGVGDSLQMTDRRPKCRFHADLSQGLTCEVRPGTQEYSHSPTCHSTTSLHQVISSNDFPGCARRSFREGPEGEDGPPQSQVKNTTPTEFVCCFETDSGGSLGV